MGSFLNKALEKLWKSGHIDRAQIQQIATQVQSEYHRLHKVFDSIKEGVLVSDLSHALVMHNRPARLFLPLKRITERSTKIWECIDDPQVASYVKMVLHNHETTTTRRFTLSTRGTPYTCEVSLLPLVGEGKIIGNIVKIEDITEQLKREAHLYNAEKLASLTTLTANVAHEIKNPLGSIAIYVQLIQKALNKPTIDRKDIARNVGVITEEIARLNTVVVDFLFAVRPMSLKREELDINGVVKGVVTFYSPEFKRHNLFVSVKLDTRLPLVEADPRYIKEAIHNIVKNAMDAMPHGGTLSFLTKIADSKVVLEIKDTGEGMDSETLKRIFEPYYTTKDWGTGIGLTQVYKIIKEHQGDVDISSHTNSGTLCRIALPISRSAQKRIGN